MSLLSVKNLLSKYSLNALKFVTQFFHKPKANNVRIILQFTTTIRMYVGCKTEWQMDPF